MNIETNLADAQLMLLVLFAGLLEEDINDIDTNSTAKAKILYASCTNTRMHIRMFAFVKR